jgi:Skp family chaperone for outer membrane proteins
MKLAGCIVVALAVASPWATAAAQTPAERSQLAAPQAAAAGRPQFPADARIGYVDLERVAALSSEAKAASAKLQDLRAKKSAEVAERGKQVDLLQQKIRQGSSLLSETAMTRLQREFERAQIDFQRFSEDAQADVQAQQQELLRAFTSRLFPVVGEVAAEKKLWAVFSNQSNLLWHAPAIDLSEEVARRLDQAPQPGR